MISIISSQLSKLWKLTPRFIRPWLRLGWWLLKRSRILEFIPIITPVGNFDSFSLEKKTVLIVNHEASRTGAPIVGYNLARGLSEKYNVVVIYLGSGPLLKDSQLPGVIVIGPVLVPSTNYLCGLAIKRITKKCKLEFAIVNSIESRFALEELSRNSVPTVAIVHEFMANTLSQTAFPYLVSKAGSVVFSSTLTRDDALARFPSFRNREYPIIPQGFCDPPKSSLSRTLIAKEQSKLFKLIRPKNFSKDGLVILGIGSVNYRKGVDLFVACAKKIRQELSNKDLNFVWIGKGFDPKNDANYSIYLADQIRRAGLAEHFTFVDEVSSLEAAYKNADIFLLTSRLDPLPNVAIDAFFYKLPLVCFDETTGVAEVLKKQGLRQFCVANYLDVNDMAAKALRFLNSVNLRSKISGECLEFARTLFDMKTYVSKIENLALTEIQKMQQMKLDARIIFDSKIIDWNFYLIPNLKRFASDHSINSVERYVGAFRAGNQLRKLFPGFHPGIYLEKHGLTIEHSDPVADYIRSGKPQGDWSFNLIKPKTKIHHEPIDSRIAMHIHVYYVELLPNILKRLKLNQTKIDLLVSVNSDPKRIAVEKLLSDYSLGKVYIRLVPNKGRDIGPFLTEFKDIISCNYDIVGHVHTKKTIDFYDKKAGKVWLNFLLANLIGQDKVAMADIILARMNSDNSIGMVFADDPNIIGWSDNKNIAKKIANRMKVGKLPDSFNFPVGTMFWARVPAIMPLLNLNLNWKDYPAEPIPYDGTILHAIERLFSIVVTSGGYRIELTHVNSLTR